MARVGLDAKPNANSSTTKPIWKQKANGTCFMRLGYWSGLAMARQHAWISFVDIFIHFLVFFLDQWRCVWVMIVDVLYRMTFLLLFFMPRLQLRRSGPRDGLHLGRWQQRKDWWFLRLGNAAWTHVQFGRHVVALSQHGRLQRSTWI